MKKFWNWARDETAPGARVLRLEGTIAEESWFEDDVTPAAFKGELFSDTGLRPSQTLCKPPMRCRIEASHRR